MRFRNGIRKVFESKTFYIVFSILASITIWLYVAYIENPEVSDSISGIKVVYLNEDYVTDRGLVITDRSTDTVTIKFTGKRGTVAQLKKDNVTVTVDLSNVKTKGVNPLEYDIVYPLGFNDSGLVTSSDTEWITISVDNLAEKEVSITGTFGSVEEGYLAGLMEVEPNIITVYGPADLVSQVDHAWVALQRDNISKTVDEERPFTLMDAEGHEVVSDMLTFSKDTVLIRIQVDKLKELPLEVIRTPAAGADETNSVMTITPASITISGDAETIDAINKIPLATIDLGSFPTSTTETFQITLPNGTKNLTGTTEATVTVTIKGLETRHVIATNIEAINTAQGHTVTVLTTEKDILLRGTAEELSMVTETNIRLVADLSGLNESPGVFSVIANVYVDGGFESVGPIGVYSVTVMVSNT